MSTKVIQLTRANVDSLRVLLNDGFLPDTVELTTTTALFPFAPSEALIVFDKAKQSACDKYGNLGHPVASLHAVRRKIIRAANN